MSLTGKDWTVETVTAEIKAVTDSSRARLRKLRVVLKVLEEERASLPHVPAAKQEDA